MGPLPRNPYWWKRISTVDLLVLIVQIRFFFYKISYINEEVICTEPSSPSVRFPCSYFQSRWNFNPGNTSSSPTFPDSSSDHPLTGKFGPFVGPLPRNPYWWKRISTVDLLVLTVQIRFFFYKTSYLNEEPSVPFFPFSKVSVLFLSVQM